MPTPHLKLSDMPIGERPVNYQGDCGPNGPGFREEDGPQLRFNKI